MNFSKVIRPCSVKDGQRFIPVFCKIEFRDGKLSISGVEGPKRNGDAAGSCGQIAMHYEHRNPEHNDARNKHTFKNSDGSETVYDSTAYAKDLQFAAGWNTELWFDFLETWHEWHNNELTPGCEHQRAAGWDKRPIDPTKPTTAYGKHFPGQRSDSWNMLTWITRDEHPEGLLSFPCPECGYKYGSAWLKRDVPESVIQFLQSLPTADTTPAWV